jgi:CHRD domain
MRKVLLLGLVGILGVLGISTVALADRGPGKGEKGDLKNFSARLNGWEEVPSQVTTGHGSFEARVVSATRIDYKLSYEAMEGNVTQAHIHIGSRHENGGVSAWLCGGTTGQPACPVRAGTVEWMITAEDITGPTAQGVEPGNFADLLRAVRRGETYTNVHSDVRAPGGEIRGQNRRGGGHGKGGK